MVRLKLTTRKRYYEEGCDYFITTKTHKNYPYFKNEILCELFIEELKVCKEIKKFELYAFCIIFDHVHLLLKPGEKFNISKIMKSLKENFSRDANKLLGANNDIFAGDTSTCRLRLREFIRTHQDTMSQQDIPKFRWQKSFHDHMIDNERDFDEHHGYTIYNYLKHHLPENWQYTSLNYETLIDDFT